MRHFTALSVFFALLLAQLAFPSVAFAAGGFSGPVVASIPVEFILFAAVLFFIAFVHVNTMVTAVTGAIIISAYKILFSPFSEGTGISGLAAHFGHEWVILGNLLALLLGFALLAKHFERSEIPAVLPNYMPDDWKGGFVLLVLVFVISSFLDNIAAAMIGGAVAHSVFRGKVHIGYLAAIVAASNAGGSGSVVGDTTTTMMWIAGVAPSEVFEAYIAATVALLITAIPASLQQHAYSPITKDASQGVRVDWTRVAIVAFILIAAICANLLLNLKFNDLADAFPFLGLAVWVAILVSAPLRRPDWNELPGALRGSIFLLSLVWCASMMPVEKLPEASWVSALSLGFVSAVFDNIPLTALALKQGGFDWGFLAYAVGFGGSMIWFGSSAGVALSNMYPEAKSVTRWLKHGWHVALAYVVGFFVLLTVWHWQPGSQLRGAVQQAHEAKTAAVQGESTAPQAGMISSTQ
ncbi:MAG TPA: citrate transporter [Noviherbaspirillum sp.]|uniref:citrate transporter n=1 Tax=Noviherbaspirillum sp. TaxID=1926288 RepID=UPI002B4687C9|nr:citrate transporter [Noviherbaspirillum sp.]HJV85417.1 citrate transporter [Noviherbaspirillum sp.]